MICPNCNQESSGKYCSFCGTLLETEKNQQTTQKDTERKHSVKKESSSNKSKNKKRKKKGNLGGTLWKGVRSTVSATSSVASNSVKTAWKLFMLVLQWICVGLMLLATWKLLQGFWVQRTTLGSIRGIISERNINQVVYLFLAVCCVGFGILQTLWTLSRKKMPDNGKMRRIDTGRGLTGFILFLLLALIARFINPYLPEHPYPLLGIKQALWVVSQLGTSFLGLNILGFIFCILRKIGA